MFIACILFLFFLASLMLPWINRSSINKLKKLSFPKIKKRDFASQSIKHISYLAFPKKLCKIPINDDNRDIKIPPPKNIAQEDHPLDCPVDDFRKSDMEQNLGVKLPVWIGGIAFALAGFYLIKYSIENELLSPFLRLFLSGILGTALLLTARYAWHHTQIDRRIPQSLAGAGIAILYFISFAGVKLYEIIPYGVGFGAMFCTTILALLLSLRYGTPIALMGMVSGFVTPALMSNGSGDAVSLFSYLAMMNIAFMVIAHQKRNLWLSGLSLIFSSIWVGIWTDKLHHSGDDIIITAFLMFLSIGSLLSIYRQTKDHNLSFLNYGFLALPLALIFVTTDIEYIGAIEWGLFILMGALTMGLAYFDNRLYRFSPFISMAVIGTLFFLWQDYSLNSILIVTGLLLGVYTAIAYFFTIYASPVLLWTQIYLYSAIGLYLLSYYKLTSLGTNKDDLTFYYSLIGINVSWCLVRFFKYIRSRYYDDKDRPLLEANFVIVTNAFISSTLFILLPTEFVKIAICTQILSVAWVYDKLSLPVLRKISFVLLVVFLYLSLEKLGAIFDIIDNSSTAIYPQKDAFLQIFFPALILATSSYYLRKEKKDFQVSLLEYLSNFFILFGGYYFIRNFYVASHLISDSSSSFYYYKTGFYSYDYFFTERGFLFNLPLMLGVALKYFEKSYNKNYYIWGEYKGHNALKISSKILFALGCLGVLLGSALLHNPLWNNEKIYGVTIFNTLLINYGLPILGLYLWNREKPTSFISASMLILSIMLLSKNISFFFSDDGYISGSMEELEIYVHSIAWLIYGIILLYFGITKEHQFLRKASLAVIFLTVTKVFLYDASELEGLYRVASFFGLGLALMGLSYVYTRLLPHQKKG